MDEVRQRQNGRARILRTLWSPVVCYALCTGAAAQQQQEAPGQTDADQNPTAASLTVGSMGIAADAALVVESMAIDVRADRVVYNYKFKNSGRDKLTLAASVALPDLAVSDSEPVYYVLPSTNAENFVELNVESNGRRIPTEPYVQALALGIDRSSQLKAAHIPLIPFGEDTEKALGAAKPDTLAKLESFGLVTPRDSTRQDASVTADWSLHVLHGWTQPLEANSTADVSVAFTPIKASYTIDATSLSGLDTLNDQVCVTQQVRDALKAMLRDKGSTASVADITLANDGPARFLQNPPAKVSVRKSTPQSVVVFCGMDPATQKQDIVSGTMAGNDEAENLRVLIFDKDK